LAEHCFRCWELLLVLILLLQPSFCCVLGSMSLFYKCVVGVRLGFTLLTSAPTSQYCSLHVQRTVIQYYSTAVTYW
jgi:hypothetical protein